MRKYTLVLGTSEPQDVQLEDDGAALVGTGFDVALDFREQGLSSAQLAALAGVSVAWLDQAAGTVRLSGMEDLPLGTYYLRYTLTDGGSNVGYVPNGAIADEWRVVPV